MWPKTVRLENVIYLPVRTRSAFIQGFQAAFCPVWLYNPYPGHNLLLFLIVIMEKQKELHHA